MVIAVLPLESMSRCLEPDPDASTAREKQRARHSASETAIERTQKKAHRGRRTGTHSEGRKRDTEEEGKHTHSKANTKQGKDAFSQANTRTFDNKGKHTHSEKESSS